MFNFFAVHRRRESFVLPFLFYGFDLDIENALGRANKSTAIRNPVNSSTATSAFSMELSGSAPVTSGAWARIALTTISSTPFSLRISAPRFGCPSHRYVRITLIVKVMQ